MLQDLVWVAPVAYQLAIQSPKRVRKLVIISSTYKSSGWLPVVNNAFKNMKPEFFTILL
jgi:homoserine acetyltransferase